MKKPNDIGALPTWLKFALLIAGAVLMLTAVGFIPAEASRFKTPHWVVFVAGLAFAVTGILSFFAKYRATHRARYLLAVSLLMTFMFLISVATSLYASGSVVSIGPFVIRGAAAESVARFMYGLTAVIMGTLAFLAWRDWFRAMKSTDASS